jgi:hypothetical protein
MKNTGLGEERFEVLTAASMKIAVFWVVARVVSYMA